MADMDSLATLMAKDRLDKERRQALQSNVMSLPFEDVSLAFDQLLQTIRLNRDLQEAAHKACEETTGVGALQRDLFSNSEWAFNSDFAIGPFIIDSNPGCRITRFDAPAPEPAPSPLARAIAATDSQRRADGRPFNFDPFLNDDDKKKV